MITVDDCEWHPHSPPDRAWTETLYLAFAVPERAIFGNAYVLARPDAGVAISTVSVSRGLCHRPYEVAFCDAQMHLPCPPSFREFRLANGLDVLARSPGSYRVSYQGTLPGCTFDLDFESIHEPFDPHDAEPHAMATADVRMGPEWMSGHWEAKGRIAGRLFLHGEEYPVDCYGAMNRSWGPRPEIGRRAVAWISLNFDATLAFHVASLVRMEGATLVYGELAFGFVADNGRIFRLTSAEVCATHRELMPDQASIVLCDERRRCWRIHARAIGGHPAYNFNPCHASFRALMQLRLGDTAGWGVVANIFGLDYLSRHCALSSSAAALG
ncbi:MAG: hypothetical protein AB7G13_24620 [Lautropia sp.]